MKVNPFLAALLATSMLSIAGPSVAQTATLASKTPPVASHTVKVLPPDVSRALQIMRMPTSQPVPLLVGVYWNCTDAGHGFDLCRLVTVVCTQDQSQCAEV